MDVAVANAGVTPSSASQPRTGSVITRNTLLAACVAGLVAGYLVACVPGFDPINPFVPKRPDRPIARLLSRIARLGLWVMVFAEPPKQQPQYRTTAERCVDEGSMICHSEGW